MMPVTMRQGPIVFAHRGGGQEAPENTMSAFAHAYEAGVRHIETDAHLTRTVRSSFVMMRPWTAATTGPA